VLWVVSAADRPSLSDIVLRQGMEFILDNFCEDNVILVLTHCDLWSPDPRKPNEKTLNTDKLG